MPSKVIVNKNRFYLNSVQSNINIKKLNNVLMVNIKLRKNLSLLSNQNKKLSATMNNLLLQKLTLENENYSLKNSNIQLTSMNYTISNRLNLLKESIQMCVPALVTMSTCIPSMLENVHEMSKLEKFIETPYKEKKKLQTKTVRSMVNGMIIKQPAVKHFDLSAIVENSSPKQTPTQFNKLNFRSSSKIRPNLEPYERSNDVELITKNSYHQLNENKSEESIWLHLQKNHNNSDDNVLNYLETSLILNQMASPLKSASVSNSRDNSNNNFTETKMNHRHVTFMSPVKSNRMKNIECQTCSKPESSKTSIISDIDNSSISLRSRRSVTKNINYQEPSIRKKLRRN